MKIQEKIWVVIDAEGQVMAGRNTRAKARHTKKVLSMELSQVLLPHTPPLSIVQYKRWKKAS